MPATVRGSHLPPSNRVKVSSSLKTTDIWKKSVGNNPCSSKNEVKRNIFDAHKVDKGMNTIAKLTGSSFDTIPGACNNCGQIGHLSYQCRNNYTLKRVLEQSKNSRCTSDVKSGKLGVNHRNNKNIKHSTEKCQKLKKYDTNIQDFKVNLNIGIHIYSCY
ncbi:zinc knuckle family protein [Cryptosporidium muris RN66]|uniref:Zinc knuckle family protein n=1 Tax=Cryptosporidium muris (strain RN66) TaxID=441375 RepID=B6AE83_CRYMR|nr:zinc knuckle family protein [Cryptosporidium muris RN66]EEA06524.1 zinc knuckle family protein [Cryptosporidium muris RN66]|eukprot:XP_002140873.1 zinc knuckle family protein [Cryptosporidium muris RN66]